MEAITRSGTDIPSSRPTGPFSPNVGEEEFCELRLLGILRSSLSAYRASTGPGYPSGCPGLYNACIDGRVVFPTSVLTQRGLRFTPLLRCAGPRVVRA